MATRLHSGHPYNSWPAIHEQSILECVGCKSLNQMKNVELFVITSHQFRWTARKSFSNLLEDKKFSDNCLHPLNILYLSGHNSLHKWLYISISNQQIPAYLCYAMGNISSFSMKVTLNKTVEITEYCQKVI